MACDLYGTCIALSRVCCDNAGTMLMCLDRDAHRRSFDLDMWRVLHMWRVLYGWRLRDERIVTHRGGHRGGHHFLVFAQLECGIGCTSAVRYCLLVVDAAKVETAAVVVVAAV